jgi:homoserine O-succinyltransferase
MTVHLSSGLPALGVLAAEGLAVSAGDRAPAGFCRIGLLNLMPDKITTETQFARLLALCGRDCELVLMRPSGHRCRHAPEGHLAAFYRTWADIVPDGLDGLIVTGAPVETLAFEEVDYWRELTGILDWAAANAVPSMHVCWAGQAALHHYHGVGKHGLPQKQFGVYEQSILAERHRLLVGMPERFPVPVSRHTDVCAADLARARGLAVLAASPESGLCMVEDRHRRALCVFNHFEYDAGTLAREYERDIAAGRPVRPPVNCDLDGAGRTAPFPVWRGVAVRLFANWIAGVGALAPC